MLQNPALFAFNRGLVDPQGLARTDQKRIALAAEVHLNFVPRVLGSMAFRPGRAYLGSVAGAGKMMEFVKSTNDTALIEHSAQLMRVWVNDALITRVAVATQTTNGTFAGNITGWTLASDLGGTAQYRATDLTGAAGNFLTFSSNGTSRAMVKQQVSVAGADQNKEHALRVVVNAGPVTLRVGSTDGADDYILETVLETGTHSLALTPTGASFWIRLSSVLIRQILVQQCTVEAAGVMSLPTPWLLADVGAGSATSNLRWDQSADVMFVACYGYQQRRIERRSTRSWSIVLYKAEKGPYMTTNTGPITMTPQALNGNTTLTSSAPYFYPTHVGALFSVTSVGQEVQQLITSQNTFSNPIEVTGVVFGRSFTLIVTGVTGTGSTVTLQRSFTTPDNWSDTAAYTVDTAIVLTDGFDNQVIFYRIGVKTGNYVGGNIFTELIYSSGSITGVGRVVAYDTNQRVDVEVLTDFGGVTPSDIWAEGKWSDLRGWPSAVRFHEGRLWWAGKNGIFASVSDAFDDFDPTTVGDSGPINRTIGSGPVDTVNWLLSVQRLLMGAQATEWSCRSSALDEPMTPTDFNLKPSTSLGCAAVQAVKVDNSAIYIQRNGVKVVELSLGGSAAAYYEYSGADLTGVVPELGFPGLVRIAVQRQPDTRLHGVRSDGVEVMAVWDKNEDVVCWLTISTPNAVIEDMVVLPGQPGQFEDQVYCVVKYTINGSTVRYLEKWASELDCRGGTLNKQADAHIVYSGAPTNVITGLGHLEGQQVIVWADGVDLSPGATGGGSTTPQTTYTVAGGQIALGTTVQNAVVGLGYLGQWRSGKLGYAASQVQTALTQPKRISRLGLIAKWLHAKGLRYGQDFDRLDDLPGIEGGAPVATNAVRVSYDEQQFPFPGTWTSDLRLTLQAQAPRPATILAATMEFSVSGDG